MLLEREEPLTLLERALDRAREGSGHAVLIGGEAGIGKTSPPRAPNTACSSSNATTFATATSYHAASSRNRSAPPAAAS